VANRSLGRTAHQDDSSLHLTDGSTRSVSFEGLGKGGRNLVGRTDTG
jgi:hypothetical protein